MTPSERLNRIHQLQQAAAAQAAAERARPRDMLGRDLDMTRRLVLRLRLREFRELTMTAAELAAWRARDAEDQKDHDEANLGNASQDGMK